MGKFFHALQREQGNVSTEVLSTLGELADERLEAAPDAAEIQDAIRNLAGNETALSPVIRTESLRIPADSPLLPFDRPNSHPAEQYRIIRTKIVQHRKQPRTILVSSAGPGDGKTTTAINIAGSLSLNRDANVLLIDGDLRRATLCGRIGLPATPGLADVLGGSTRLENALIRCEQLPNLYVLPAGGPVADPTELLDSMVWRSTCVRLREMFQYIVMDSPPVGVVADFDLLQVASDGVILVLRPDHTNRADGFKAIEAVGKDRLIGVVMNWVEDWVFSKSRQYAPYENAAPKSRWGGLGRLLKAGR